MFIRNASINRYRQYKPSITCYISAFAMMLLLSSTVTALPAVQSLAKDGDLPFFNLKASGHQTPADGRVLNKLELEAIADSLNLPTTADMVIRLDGLHAYNAGQSAAQKEAGAFLALSMYGKFRTMPPKVFGDDDKTASIAYGGLKVKAMKGDAAGIRADLEKYGGKAYNLTDEQLIQLWSGNEHQNLHAVLFGRDDIKHAIHATSLSDHNQQDPTQLQLGGFNDKGQFPQWGWFAAAKRFVFLVGFLNKFQRHAAS